MKPHLVSLLLWCVAGGAVPAAAQTFEVTPFVGSETSGSYPVENPSTVTAFRADAGKMYGAFFDYTVVGNLQAEFEWAHNPTTYSAQDALSGQYSRAFATSIDQYQFGALYYLRDPGIAWRPYVAISLGFTHDSNSGDNPGRTAAGFGLGGGVRYALSSHVGIRGDARWMPTHGSDGMSSLCDEFGNCYPTVVRNYLQRFDVTIGLTVGL